MTTTKAGAHTQGRLVIEDYGDCLARLVIKNSDWSNGLYIVDGKLDSEDARRLAACWNMCENISTESIEGGMTLVERIGAYADYMAQANDRRAQAEETSTALMAELAAARALLEDAMQAIDDEADPDIVYNQIREFLKGKK